MPILLLFFALCAMCWQLSAATVTPDELKFDKFESRWNDLPKGVRESPGGSGFFKRFKDAYDKVVRETEEAAGDSEDRKKEKQNRRNKQLGKLARDLNRAVNGTSLLLCGKDLETCLGRPASKPEDCQKAYIDCIDKASRKYYEFMFRKEVAGGAKIVGKATSDFNCLGMIMGALLGKDFSNMLGTIDTRDRKAVNRITEAILRKKGFTLSEQPCACGIVLYYDDKGNQIHIGVIVDPAKKTVLSKWGNGKTPVWVHPIDKSPYGNRVKIYCPPRGQENWCQALKKKFGL